MAAQHYIRDWRRFRGMTLEGLADRTGLSAAVISRIERGDQRYNQDALEAIALALSCKVSDLISRSPAEDNVHSIIDDIPPAARQSFVAMIEALRGAPPPGHDAEAAEQRLIGAVIVYGNSHDVLSTVGPNAFNQLLHRRIWRTLQEEWRESAPRHMPDPVWLDARLREQQAPGYAEAGGLQFLALIADGAPAEAGIPGLVDEVMRGWSGRERADLYA
jgi:transcriptional regulator with XRE-family HTH domain